MTFLNYIMLLALAGVGIPILIHLLNRRRAKVVEWGAMRFLMASVASRNRRILLEELLLMALRCVLVALLVVAMARPFLPTRSFLSWAIVLPAGILAVVLLAVAVTSWSYRGARRWLLGAAGGLLLLSGAAVAVEHVRQQQQWGPTDGSAKDIAIVLDGSLSMTLQSDGESNFARAIADARAVIAALRPGDAASIHLAGPLPRPLVPSPISDKDELLARLGDARPIGGSLQVLPALNAAVRALAQGHNAPKRIVLITDAQNVGWDLASEGRWEFLAGSLGQLPTKPQLIVRRLVPPPAVHNLCLTDLALSRPIVGTDRSVGIDVRIANGGTAPAGGTGVTLYVDGLEIERKEVEAIVPNASQTVSFRHRFETDGYRVVSATLEGDDDLPGDNALQRVVHVLEELPVLLVDGAPSPEPLRGAAALLELAMAPRGEEGSGGPAGGASRGGAVQDPPIPRFLLRPQTLSALELANVGDLSKYRVIVLANVPILPKAGADALERFVRRGGGLLIVPGDRCRSEFYNEWMDRAGRRIVPARLTERAVGGEAVHCALKTFTHPALATLADTTQSDAESALIHAFWALDVDDTDDAVRVAGRLDCGAPLLVERRIEKGYVLLSAVAFDERDTNLPRLQCFVPLVHELVHFLSVPLSEACNVRPGAEVALPLPALPDLARRVAAGDVLEVATPDEREAPAQAVVFSREGRLRVRFPETRCPGLYRIALPDGQREPDTRRAADGPHVPFVVLSDPAESRLDGLAEGDWERLGGRVDLARAESTDELTSFIAGGVPGREMWTWLVVLAVLTAIGEIALTRWIAIRRKAHAIRAVRFGEGGIDVQSFRSRAEELLAVPAAPAGASSAKGGRA